MPFWELTIPAFPDASEGLTNFLWELGALGVLEEEQNGAPAQLRAYFAETAAPSTLAAAVSRYCADLRALDFAVPHAEPTLTPIFEGAWAEAWRQSFPPRPVGRRLLVAPPWEVPTPPDGRQLVIIEPGRAFGTGTHGSTLGCLALLDTFLETHRVTHATDVGTGTGILAVAALRLGVTEVTAVDIDPDALREAQKNAELNGVAGRLSLRLTGPEGLQDSCPLLLANLLASSHTAFAPHYRRLLTPGGTLILGGLLPEEEPAVISALATHGFAPLERAQLDGWLSLRLTTAEIAH